MKTIEAGPLTPEAFSSFGQVLAGGEEGPNGPPRGGD
jgi:ureidoglycolate hydrolase